MLRFLFGLLIAASLSMPAFARIEKFPPNFKTQEIETNGAKIFVRVGGQGPAILMLHGFGDTGDMWQPLAVA